MQVEERRTSEIFEYSDNPRSISNEAVQKTAASIAEFGFRVPIIVDENGIIIAGHTRLKAANLLGLSSVPVHVAVGLTEAQVKAFRIAENRISVENGFNVSLLASELLELRDTFDFDLTLTGFDDFELKSFLAEDESEPAPQEEPESKPKMKTVKMTAEQHEVFTRALQALRSDESDMAISDGRAIELWAAEYLSASPYQVQ